MFKLWIDRKGSVQSFSVGSIEEQHSDMVKVLAYLQSYVSASEGIAKEVAESHEVRETAKRVRREKPSREDIGSTD